MQVGFWIPNQNYLSNYGTIVQTLVARGHSVFLFGAVGGEGQKKPGTQVNLQDFAVKGDSIHLLSATWDTLAEKLKENQVQFILFLDGGGEVETESAHRTEILRQIRNQGVKIISVPHFYETANTPGKHFSLFDRAFYHGARALVVHKLIRPEDISFFQKHEDRFRFVGSPLLDQLDTLRANREGIRKKYGISAGKKVVLLMSLKLQVKEPWRRFAFAEKNPLKGAIQAIARGKMSVVPEVFTTPKYPALIQAIRSFCDRNNAVLVTKSRKKNGDPEYLHTLSDIYVDTNQVFPHPSLELLAITDLCIHFQSATVHEAVKAGVPSISIAIPQSHIAARDALWYQTWIGSKKQPSDFHQYPGVTWCFSIREVIRRLKTSSLSDFKLDSKQQRNYLEHFSVPQGLSASEKIVQELESLEKTSTPSLYS